MLINERQFFGGLICMMFLVNIFGDVVKYLRRMYDESWKVIFNFTFSLVYRCEIEKKLERICSSI